MRSTCQALSSPPTLVEGVGEVYRKGDAWLHYGDALDFYERWPSPTVIVSDGPYGLGSFPGDPPSVDTLAGCYRPHLQAWSRRALPSTTLWFWNSELGWATVHNEIVKAGWEFRNCHVWDKGLAHIAGNTNTGNLRKFPVTTEVCVQYVKKTRIEVDGVSMTLQEWLRHEWVRSGLPLCRTNEACGVKNAATRKYFTADHLWYFPPPEAFGRLADYANQHGDPAGRPYFSLDGVRPLTPEEWALMRAKFQCSNGTTNVWRQNAVRGRERLKKRTCCVHMNQKPLRLLELCIRASSEPGDVVWEPFGGLCSATLAAKRLGRKAYAAEIIRDYFHQAVARFADELL